MQVRSKNFNLIGNAPEREIRRVATKLEQFREVFQRLFGGVNFGSPIPTTVVVFKNDGAYKPFKPVKSNGKIENFIAGYFIPGEDVNYITLSTEHESAQTFSIIFHEYTHFIVRNNFGESRIPPWFNEGLAEYYETFAIKDDREVTLGALQERHLLLLEQRRLIPFDTFFNIDNYSLHEQGDDGVGIFYAQAWALMHYLIQGNKGARNQQFSVFLDLLLAGKNAKEAFAQAFQTDYATMEKELEKYIAQQNFTGTIFKFDNKLTFENEMTSAPLPDADAKAYLGDLLYHLNRLPEAESLLQEAIAGNPKSSMAQTSLALVKLRQKNYAEARKYLEQAVSSDSSNYLAYYNYAYILSREAMSEYGFVSSYDRDLADKMRAYLKKAIALNPDFAESYSLYAFISVVRNDEINESLAYMGKALKIAPGNQFYLLRAAELYLRMGKFSTARSIAEKVVQTASERETKIYAQNTLDRINSTEAQMESIKNYKPRQVQPAVSDKPLSEEELARLRDKAMLESLNEALRKPSGSEKRIFGRLTKIECVPQQIIYYVKVGDQTVKLQSASFDSVSLTAYNTDMKDLEIKCGAFAKEVPSVIIYRPSAETNAKTSGEIVSIEFVPANFKFLN